MKNPKSKIQHWINNDLVYPISKYCVRPWIDVWFWVMYRFNPKNKYHVIYPRTLKPGLHSASDRILHATMEVMTEFYEAQDPKDWQYTQEMSLKWIELSGIYKWWNSYQNKEDELPELPEPPLGWKWEMIFMKEYSKSPYAIELKIVQKIYQEYHKSWQIEEELNLQKVIKLRPYLLT